MKWASLALIALVCACGSATPQARSASPAPSTPVAGSPSPIPSVGPTPVPITQVSFSCRLPFVQSPAGGHWQAGFISLPAGTFTADPNAPVLSVPTPQAPSSSAYYDRAVSRWLPVGREAVAPDGFNYAFTDRPATNQQSPPTRATLHVVSVKTGVDVAFDGGYWSSPYYVLDYAAEGIYLFTSGGGQRYGLWLMNPATGAVKQVAASPDVQGSGGNKTFWVGKCESR